MSFIVGIAEKVVSEVASSWTPKKIAGEIAGIAMKVVNIFHKIDDVATHPQAQAIDQAVRLAIGDNPKLKKAARAVLLLQRVFELRYQGDTVKEAASHFADTCDDVRPIPIRALRQKETYDPELLKKFKVKFICSAPPCLVKGVLRGEMVAEATGDLIKESARFGGKIVDVVFACFGGDSAADFAVSNMVTAFARMREMIKKNPQVFVKDIQAQEEHIDTILQWIGTSYRTNDLIKSLLGEKILSPVAMNPPPGVLDNVRKMAMGAAFTLLNMTTDLQCAPLGINQVITSQPVSTYRSDDGNSRSASAPRPNQDDKRRFL